MTNGPRSKGLGLRGRDYSVISVEETVLTACS